MAELSEQAAILEGTRLISKLEAERDHALKHDNFGKAATLDGEAKGVARFLRLIESGDLHK